MKSIKRIELRARRQVLAEDEAPYNRIVSNSRGVASIANALLGEEDQEVVIVFLIDSKNRVNGYQEISRGTLTQSLVQPAQVFRAAIVQGAVSVILAHNHPSGDPTPSQEDKALTERLQKASVILDVKLLDHVIVGQGAAVHFSFADAGLL